MNEEILVSKRFLLHLNELLAKFDYDPEGYADDPTSTFSADVSQDWFYHLKNSLDKLCNTKI